MRLIWSGVVVGLAACGSSDGGRGLPDANLLEPDAAGPADPTLRIDVEPPGANCPFGGEAVHVGADRDRDGTLDDDEITATSYLCDDAPPPVLEGSVVINNSIDAEMVRGVTEITGDLLISAIGLTSLDLSALRRVGGLLACSGLSTPTLALPALEEVGGLLSVGAACAAGSLAAPALTSLVAAYLVPRATATVELPNLTEVADLTIQGQPGPQVSLPALARVDSIFVSGASVQLPALASVQDNLQCGNTMSPYPSVLSAPVLTALPAFQAQACTVSLPAVSAIASDVAITLLDGQSVDLGALTSVAGGLQIAGAGTVDAPALTSVDGTLWLQGNVTFASGLVTHPHALWIDDATPQLPALASVASLRLSNNPGAISLPALTSVTDTLTWESNPVGHSLLAPNLTQVGSLVLTEVTSGVAMLSLPALVSAGTLQVISQSLIQTIDLPALTTVAGPLTLSYNSVLATVNLGALTSANVTINSNPQLAQCLVAGPCALPGAGCFGNDGVCP